MSEFIKTWTGDQVFQVQQAINASCSCGGRGPKDGCCPACEVWHRLNGREISNRTDSRAERNCNHCNKCGLDSHGDDYYKCGERFATGIEAAVCSDIAKRQELGIKKYGVTVADNPLDLSAWLQHAYEENLDFAVYLKRAISEHNTIQARADKLDALCREMVGRWISVDESLPPDKEKVLVWAGAVYVGWRWKNRKKNQGWRLCCCGAHYSYGSKTQRTGGSITHWMRVLAPNAPDERPTKPSTFTADADALARVHPLVRSDGLFRCVVCCGTKCSQGQSLEHRKPCGNCKGEGYLPLPPYRSTSTYPMR